MRLIVVKEILLKELGNVSFVLNIILIKIMLLFIKAVNHLFSNKQTKGVCTFKISITLIILFNANVNLFIKYFLPLNFTLNFENSLVDQKLV